jgi:hypothetical protein
MMSMCFHFSTNHKSKMIKPTKIHSHFVTQHDTLYSIYNSMKPIYTVCKVIGLSTLSIEQNGQLKSKKSNYVYFGLYLTIYTLLVVYSLVCFVRYHMNFILISKHIIFFESCILALLMLFVIIFTFFLRNMQIKALDLLSHVDVYFVRGGFSVQYKNLLQKSYIILCFAVISLTIRSFLLFLTLPVSLIGQATLIVSITIKAFSKYQFVVFVQQLQMRFTNINKAIRFFFSKNSKVDKLVLNSAIRSVSPQLYLLCRLHYKLAYVVQKINSAFAVQLLVSIGVSLCDLLLQAYYLYYIATGKIPIVTIIMIVCPVIWLVDETVEIYWLVHVCASTCEQANETPTILHELRNSYSDLELENHVSICAPKIDIWSTIICRFKLIRCKCCIRRCNSRFWDSSLSITP